MSGRSRANALGLCAVVALLSAYLVVRAVDLFRAGTLSAALLGVGVLLLVLVGAVLLVGEVRFGADSQRLGERLAEEGALGEVPEHLARLPSGRLTRAAADELFDQRRRDVEQAPTDWRAWFRLATAYGEARDTPRGRRAMRKAISLEKAERA